MASVDPTWRRLLSALNTALTVGAAAATFLAIAVVIGLFWLVYSLPSSERESPPLPAAHLHPQPAVRQQVPAQSVPPARAPRSASAQHVPPVAARGAAPSVPARHPPAAAPAATPGPNSDLEKNRAIGRALTRLGQDPDIQRKLGIDPSKLPP